MCRVLIVALLAAGSTSLTDVSPVQKVVQLLDELSAKVAVDVAAEGKLMEEYTMWCDSETNSKEDAITDNTRTIGDLQATIQEETANIDSLTSEIEDLASKISADEADLAKATELRQSEHKEFTANEKELVDTIDTLDRAIIVLKRGQTNFMQTKKVPKELTDLAAGLSEIVKASWINSQQRTALQSLLQAGTDDEDLTLQPQATVAAYESKGGSILEVLADMRDKAKAGLSDTRKNEMTSNHEFMMLEQGLNDELSVMKKRLGEAKSQRSTSEELKHVAEGDLTGAQDSKASDEKYLAEVKQSCSLKEAEWAQRQKDAAEEMTAIKKAKEILESGVKAFVQMGLIRVARNADESLRRSQVGELLRKLSKTNHGFALSQVMAAVRNDPFSKVKGLIQAMLERLTKEAAEEAEAKSFCDTEISESREKQVDLSAKLDQHAARIAKGEAAKAKLQQSIKIIEGEVGSLVNGQKDATAMRQSEHAEYTRASQEYQDSATAVAQAIQVLEAYYSGSSFMQLSSKIGQPEFGSAKKDVASTIISMLEVAESDFTRLYADAKAAENSAQASYDKLTQSNDVAKAAMDAESKGFRSEVKSIELSLLNYKDDHASTSDELDAVMSYLDKLKPQCETKVMTYADRKAKREQEIAGLKEALTILEG